MDRRGAPRVRVSVPVGVEVGGLCAEGQICDISVSGARIETSSVAPPVGTDVQVTFVLGADAPPFEVPAQVVRQTRKGGFAVQFSQFEPKLDDMLGALLERAFDEQPATAQLRRCRVEDLMHDEVARVTAGDTLAEARRLLATASPRCVVVCEKDRPVGMLTSHDLATAESGDERSLRDAMRVPIVVASRRERLGRLLADPQLLTARYLPVIDDHGALCGILSQTDLLFFCAKLLLGDPRPTPASAR
jgi:CBS domain-containing protein